MQRIVKNTTVAKLRSFLVYGYDKSGVSKSVASVTLKVGGTETAVADFDGTVTRIGTTAAHKCVMTQAQSNSFALGEEIAVVVPNDTDTQELGFVLLVCEDDPALAPVDPLDDLATLNRSADGVFSIRGRNFTTTTDATYKPVKHVTEV